MGAMSPRANASAQISARRERTRIARHPTIAVLGSKRTWAKSAAQPLLLAGLDTRPLVNAFGVKVALRDVAPAASAPLGHEA